MTTDGPGNETMSLDEQLDQLLDEMQRAVEAVEPPGSSVPNEDFSAGGLIGDGGVSSSALSAVEEAETAAEELEAAAEAIAQSAVASLEAAHAGVAAAPPVDDEPAGAAAEEERGSPEPLAADNSAHLDEMIDAMVAESIADPDAAPEQRVESADESSTEPGDIDSEPDSQQAMPESIGDAAPGELPGDGALSGDAEGLDAVVEDLLTAPPHEVPPDTGSDDATAPEGAGTGESVVEDDIVSVDMGLAASAASAIEADETSLTDAPADEDEAVPDVELANPEGMPPPPEDPCDASVSELMEPEVQASVDVETEPSDADASSEETPEPAPEAAPIDHAPEAAAEAQPEGEGAAPTGEESPVQPSASPQPVVPAAQESATVPPAPVREQVAFGGVVSALVSVFKKDASPRVARAKAAGTLLWRFGRERSVEAFDALRPVAFRGAVAVSRPVNARGPLIRDTLGWIALWTAFLAVCVWAYLLIFRTSQTPVPTTPPETAVGLTQDAE